MHTIKCTRCNGKGNYEGFGRCFKCNGSAIITVSEKEYQEYIKYNESGHKCNDTYKTWEEEAKEMHVKQHNERMEKVEQLKVTVIVNEANYVEDENLLDLLS